ncbi:MAG: ATP-dependent DNA helicase RecG [Bacillota bacterium]
MDSLKQIKGIGEKTLGALNAADIFTFEDLYTTFPSSYDKRILYPLNMLDDVSYRYIECKRITKPKVAYIRKNLKIISFYALIEEVKYLIKVYNQTYVLRLLNQTEDIIIYTRKHDTKNELIAQKIITKNHFEEGIFPIYNIPHINDKSFYKYVTIALEKGDIPSETLPSSIRNKHGLIDIETFYKQIHKPKSEAILEAVKTRLTYETLFTYLLKVHIKKRFFTHQKAPTKTLDYPTIEAFIKTLPFTLTEGQNEALKAILNDLEKPVLMHRMLQGDTGSGKTIVALIAMIAVIQAGYQVAFMAPTEILAQQHYDTFNTLLKHTPYAIELLTGSTYKTERTRIEKGLKTNNVLGVVGTHALFSKGVEYHNLGLIITDEQHRFGVMQRRALSKKAIVPDQLHLSATPIPRSLAMTLFNDMDISTITTKPKNRVPITTKVMTKEAKETVRNAMRETLTKNEQIFIVAPVIETNEDLKLFGVDTIYNVIKKRYKNARVGLLHGKLNANEKARIIDAFKHHELDIIVTTTVIEVGIDIPNATLMIIYHAERFGYAQLHQLRGRVGRSSKGGLCLMIYEGDKDTRDRIKKLETIHDGFTLSEYDLKQRGFGDIIGTVQSGKLEMFYTKDTDHIEQLKTINQETKDIVENYPHDEACVPLIKRIYNELNKP